LPLVLTMMPIGELIKMLASMLYLSCKSNTRYKLNAIVPFGNRYEYFLRSLTLEVKGAILLAKTPPKSL